MSDTDDLFKDLEPPDPLELLNAGMASLRRLQKLRERREYGCRVKELRRWRGRKNAPRRYRPIIEPDLTPELGDLRLPLIMPDESPGSPYVAPLADWRDGLYFRPDGSQIKELDAVLEWAQTGWADKRIAATTLFRGGVRIWVSTVFLGMDAGILSPVPLLWETMIFVGTRNYRPSTALDWQWRYASREAARYGHRTIVRRLIEGRRNRSMGVHR